MQFKPLHLKTTVTEEKAEDCDKVIVKGFLFIS